MAFFLFSFYLSLVPASSVSERTVGGALFQMGFLDRSSWYRVILEEFRSKSAPPAREPATAVFFPFKFVRVAPFSRVPARIAPARMDVRGETTSERGQVLRNSPVSSDPAGKRSGVAITPFIARWPGAPESFAFIWKVAASKTSVLPILTLALR